jgi:DegV family protein with EDD domain
MIDIMTDSCADLSEEILVQHNIRSIPLQVFINNHNFRDGELTINDLFSLVGQSGQLPITSAPSIQEFVDFFKHSRQGLYIGISSRLSATIQNSKLALQDLPNHNIHVIDSLNLSAGIGYLALKASNLRNCGFKLDQIANEIQNIIPKIRTSFFVDTMEYLYKGGRCSALQAIFGSILQIRPVIEVREDGTLGVKDKIRGSRNKALDSLFLEIKKNISCIDLQSMFIMHTDCSEDAIKLRDEITKFAPFQNIYVTTAGATIASHCGPGTIGILYCLK